MRGEKKTVSRKWAAALACIALALAAAFAAVVIHGGYADRVLAKLGLRRSAVPVSWAEGWERCLKYMDVDAEVVFFGDSITSGGDFNALFPEKSVCNLGVPGDTIEGMTARAGMIAAVKPEKVFILGGINSLCDDNSDAVLKEYGAMLDRIGGVTDAEVYIQGILPVSTKQEERLHVKNTTITRFNERIADLAAEKGFHYIDLPGFFLADGVINPDYTKEGIHLTEEGYRVWADAIAGFI